MRYLPALLLVAACEKSGPVETTPGATEATTGPAGPTPVLVEPRVQTMPSNAVLERAPHHADEPANSPRAQRERRAAQLDEAAQQLADRLTVLDTSSLASLGDMASRTPNADLGAILATGNTNVAIGGGSTGRAARGGDLRGGGANVDSRGPDVPSVGRVNVLPPRSSTTSSLTPELVLRKIASAYIGGIRRCYKTSLAQDPALRGKLALSLKVNETGRTIAPNVTGLTKELDECVVAQMASWRFPIPKDENGDPSEAAFELAIQLVPE
jgi:hypothetical protein